MGAGRPGRSHGRVEAAGWPKRRRRHLVCVRERGSRKGAAIQSAACTERTTPDGSNLGRGRQPGFLSSLVQRDPACGEMRHAARTHGQASEDTSKAENLVLCRTVCTTQPEQGHAANPSQPRCRLFDSRLRPKRRRDSLSAFQFGYQMRYAPLPSGPRTTTMESVTEEGSVLPLLGSCKMTACSMRIAQI